MTKFTPRRLLAAITTLMLTHATSLAASVPAALQGQWEYGYVSPIEYYDPSSGKYAESSGTSEIIRIRPDGTYERSGIIVMTTYSCTSKLLSTSKSALTATCSPSRRRAPIRKDIRAPPRTPTRATT